MKTVFGKQKNLISILVTCLIMLMLHVTSFDAAPAAGGICQVGDTIAPGESCTYPDTTTEFSVNASGTGQFLFLSAANNLNLEDTTINGVTYTFVAKKLASGSWKIEQIGTDPGTTNTAPVFTDGTSTTRSVAENTAANTNIGTAIAATDADNDTLTYTLGGTDAASFGIVSTSGQLQTKAALDYETKTSYSVTITVSDGNSGSDSITVTINVTDVNETIIISSRFVPVADRTLEVRDAIVAAVPNVTDAAKVTKAQVAAITSLNLRNAGIIALKAGDFSGMTALTSLNLYNNQLSSLPNRIFEGLTSLTTVRLGRNAVDPLPFIVSLEKVADGEFKAVAPAVALFNIVLPITVTNGSVTGGATTVTIPRGSMVSDTLAVTRTAGTTAHVTVDIEAFPNLPHNHYGYTLAKSGNLPLIIIRGTNTAPVFTNGTSTTRSVAENTASNTNIGSPVSATDADRDTLTYRLGGIDASTFNIVSTSGQLQTKAALDYETKISYSVTVSVFDGNGGSNSIAVRINVTDVRENSAPVFTEGSTATRSVAENTAAGQHIGTAVAATDADGNTLAYTLGGTDAASFGIDRTTGHLKTKASLDYETKTTYTVTITVSDGTLTDTITVTINVTDITENRAPVFTESSTATRSVAENTAAGQHIGTAVAATDADGNTLAYTLGGTDAASFGIDRTTGHLKTKASLDYETKTTYTVTITVSDGTLTDTITVTINVTDVDESLDTPSESSYDHIEGPWLWMIAAGGNINTDNLSEASDGVITEAQIAQNGVNEDDHFNELQWTSGRLLPTTVCGIFLCSSDNVINVVRKIGLTNSNQLSYYSAYAFINIYSPRDQNNVLMGVGSDDSIKVWLNGSVVYKNDISRRTTGIQNRFRVNLNAGNNLLFVKVCNHGLPGFNDDWGMFFKIYLDTQDYTISLPMKDIENTAPVFTEGSSTARSVAENTVSGLGIGTAVSATDANNYTLTYSLGGTDAAAFSIDRTTGQLKTKTALDYESKRVYRVTITVSDGSLTDTITVTINITDIDETVPNRAPVFTEGSTATRSVAENTAAGQHIGTAVAATDADGNTLAYTLGGTDAVSFGIDRTTGHLKTKAALDYETKTTYTVTITVSDGTLTDTITVIINVTDVDDTQQQQQQIAAVCQVGDILGPGESCTYPDTDAVFSVQNDGESRWNIPNLPPLLQWINQVSIGGSMRVSTTVNGVDYHIVAEQTGSSWEIKEIGDQGVQEPETPQSNPPGTTPTLTASTSSTLTEATLHENVVTLTLSNGSYVRSIFDIQDAVSVSGITGVSYPWHDPDKKSDTELSLKLEFDGNMTTDGTLTFTVGSDAIQNYSGSALTATISVSATTESITASTSSALTEATLDGAKVTLTLSGRKFERSIFDIRDEVSVSGITGVTFPWHDPDRSSDTVLTLKLEFDGDMTTNGTLTFTIGADAIAGYKGSDLTAQINVTATGGTSTPTPANNAPVFSAGTTVTRSVAENTASGTNIGTAVSATDSDNDTLTYTLSGTDASSFSIVSTSGQLQTSAALDYETKNTYSVTVSVSDGNGGSDSITVTINITNITETSTATLSITSSSSITEATLHDAVISLNLSGYTFERAFWDLDDEISVSGITGVSYDDFFDVDRISSTEVQIELSFDGNMTEDGTLTFTVSSGAIVNYDGSALTATLSVSAVTESITASTSSALTEATLDGTEVTLTLSGRKFARSIFDIRDAVSVSGITGVTFPWHDPDKKSDTELSLKLEFDGDMTTNGTLTFTVGADAIAGYNGPDLTAQVTVTASGGNALGANFPNPFNPETWIPYQLSKFADVTLTIYNMRGVAVRKLMLGHKAAGIYQNRSRAAYWDGKNEFGEPVASGVYFYMLKAGDFTATRKMLIRK